MCKDSISKILHAQLNEAQVEFIPSLTKFIKVIIVFLEKDFLFDVIHSVLT